MHSNPYGSRRIVGLALAKVLLFAFAHLPFVSAVPVHSSLAPRSFVLNEDGKPPDDPSLWLYLGIAAALVISGGAFAGLTIALMGQDEIYLQVIQTSGEGAEQKNAATVLKLLKRGKHWVLVTLLLSNVIVNETLPIVLDRSLGGGWPAVIGSTALIVIFGEVVPQSICVRYGLPIGAWMAPCVLALMYITAPIAWPIAKLLDRILGEDHGTFYKKAGLKTLVTLHKNFGEAGEQLNSDEVTIISAVLDLKEKSVGSIMIPMDDVFTMSADVVLDEKMMDLILSQGYSRIPIHSPDNPENFVGMLLVKMLITYDPEDCKQVRDFALATLPETRAETSCLDIVNFFQEGKSHMVLVSEYPGEDHGALGVVTLEDVIEELIGEEIIDESDVFIDVHKAIRRLAPAPKSRVPKGKIVTEPPLSSMIDNADITTEISTPMDEADSVKHRLSLVGRASPPQTTFYLRRSHTYDSSSSSTPIIRRGPTPEIREQLKHLGPSNLASRPRQTRYTAVKIKPPSSTSPTRSGHLSSHIESSPDTRRRASESTSLLGSHVNTPSGVKSAGKTASDAVRALQASYGSVLERPTPFSLDDPASPIETANKAVGTGDDLISSTNRPSAAPLKTTSNRSNTTQSTSAVSRSISPNPPFQPRGPTRTGSITEQVVDSNGIRKVILHTSETPSPTEDGPNNRFPGRPGSSEGDDAKSGFPKTNTIKPSVVTNPNVDGNGDVDEGLEVQSRSKAKKKKSKKKKSKSKSKPDDGTQEESQPLLR